MRQVLIILLHVLPIHGGVYTRPCLLSSSTLQVYKQWLHKRQWEMLNHMCWVTLTHIMLNTQQREIRVKKNTFSLSYIVFYFFFFRCCFVFPSFPFFPSSTSWYHSSVFQLFGLNPSFFVSIIFHGLSCISSTFRFLFNLYLTYTCIYLYGTSQLLRHPRFLLIWTQCAQYSQTRLWRPSNTKCHRSVCRKRYALDIGDWCP